MIDIHCHILPEIDDGAESIETSLKMLKIAEDDGTKTIIATPHYYTGMYEVAYNDIINHVKFLNEKAKKNNINIEILPGQEVFLNKYTINLYKQGVIGTLNNTKYMLVELPFDEIPKNALDILYELKILGITPILAHPERYLYIVKKHSIANQFIEEGCLFQLNSGSINGLFGKDVQKTAETILRHRMYHFVSSDAHTINKRCPGLKKSFDTILQIDKELVKMLENNVEMCIMNDCINQKYEKISDRKSFFDIFRR
jgi:protein-tyrosine phosphatase